MVDSIDDISKQARQGSVAAIIQIMNDKLASSGVRTRAMFENGVLQLLCEAATPEQLEQSVLVDRIRQILESISPRNIRRVNINSRIVREQQLLWLEEIHREPENLLWSEEITLRRPNLIKQLSEDMKLRRIEQERANLPKPTSARQMREQRQFWRGIVGGTSLSLFLLLVGGVVYVWLGNKSETTEADTASTAPSPATSPGNPPANPSANNSPAVSNATSPAPTTASATSDPFAEAVRLAEQASFIGKTAESPAQWLDLAAKWQQASDLMGKVEPGDERYEIAQDRTVVYRRYSESALQQAEKRRAQPTESTTPTQ